VDEDNSVTGVPDNAGGESDQVITGLFNRAAELQKIGLSWLAAVETSDLEARIARWPKDWGDDLQVLIYGDFDAPDHDLDYPEFGITVEAGVRENTVIKTALCVVNARVKVRDRNLSAVLDAVTRLNTFLGIWTILDWGNRGIGWWCHLTSGTMGGPGERSRKMASRKRWREWSGCGQTSSVR